mmetsp:Transcript_18164/g.27148  ORF Transcript_18164/g.27148 Transcript_18164/m.27148 type:complete len:194 (-) Transcript_18164:119-700(-)
MKNPAMILALGFIPLILLMTPIIDARKMEMVGTYKDVDVEKEQLLVVTEFALTSLLIGESDNTYSFSTMLGGSEVAKINEISVKVVEVQMQVVAGMNYKMTVGLLQGEDCLGAFKVTVYDQFGDMSVTNWGDEVSCEDIQDVEGLGSFSFDLSEEVTNKELQGDNISSGGNDKKFMLSLSFSIATILAISTIL